MDKTDEITWNSLNDEKRNEIVKIKQNFDMIFEFQCKVNENLMIYIFGEQLGKHYWYKFTIVSNRNIFQFIKCMDSDKKGDLIANIFLNETLYENCHKQ